MRLVPGALTLCPSHLPDHALAHQYRQLFIKSSHLATERYCYRSRRLRCLPVKTFQVHLSRASTPLTSRRLRADDGKQ